MEKAESGFKAVLEVDPRNAQIHNQLGILYGKTDLLEKAQLQFEAALAIDPEFESALSNLKKVQKLGENGK